ncbi:transcription initiation at TATA-containing promoter protein, partial [Perkinsus olseni]
MYGTPFGPSLPILPDLVVVALSVQCLLPPLFVAHLMTWRDECKKVRARVEKADRGYFFVKPVVECELPDEVKRRYRLVEREGKILRAAKIFTAQAISSPMDLRTVGERLENDPLYSSHRFEEDMNLMFSNCFLFNTPGEYAHTEGKRLKKLFDTAWRTAKERINRGRVKREGTTCRVDSEKAPSERTARSGTRRRAPSSTVSSPQSRRSSKRGGRTQATRSTKKTAAGGNKGGRKASEG